MTLSDDGAVDLLSEMLRIPSLCGQEDHIAALLLGVMERAGFDAYRDEIGNVVGTFGPPNAERSVVILGHMDTVPGTVAVETLDGGLYGRGAVDAKGPLATGLVAAMRAAAHTGVRVTVIGAVQEEGPSAGARHLASSSAPDYLVIAEPGGWDAIVMGYKGSQRFSVELSQPSAHTAGADPTVCERLIVFWNHLTVWCEEQTPPGTKPASVFGRLTATLISMSSSSDGLQDTAALSIGLRLPPGVAPETLHAAVPSLLKDAIFRFDPGEPAVRGDKTSPLVSAFMRSIRAEGGTPRFKVKTGTSDMNIVGPVWGCPMLAYGPGDSRLDHTPHEHVMIEEYLRGIRVVTRVLEEL